MGAAFPGEEPSSNGKNTIGDGGNPIAQNAPINRLHAPNSVKTALAPGRTGTLRPSGRIAAR